MTAPRLAPPLALVWRAEGNFRPPPAWPASLREATRRLDWGAAGSLHLAAPSADVAEDATTWVVRLGSFRDRAGAPLRARDLLRRRLATPEAIDEDAIHGSGSLIAIDRTRPRFAAITTLFGSPRLEYRQSESGLDLTSEPRLMLPLIGRPEIDPRSEAAFVLLRLVSGERSLLRGVRRLGWGRALRFDGATVSLGARRTLRAGEPEESPLRLSPETLAWLDGRLSAIVASWRGEAEELGGGWANLLSGGLDSSLLQSWLTRDLAREAGRSFSFGVGARGHAFEIEYARDAAVRLESRHTLVEVSEREFPLLLERSVVAMADPCLYNESLPGFLALAEALARGDTAPRLLFSGSGADGVHGSGDLLVLELVERLRKIPGSRGIFRLAELWGGRPRAVASRAAWVDWIGAAPPAAGLARRLEPMLRWFGGETVRGIVEDRAALCDEIGAASDQDRTQLIGLGSCSWEPALAVSRLFSAFGIDAVHPYLDSEALAMTRRFEVRERYLRPGFGLKDRLKPIQLALLARHGLGAMKGRRKGGGLFTRDLERWMRRGSLRDLVRSIERPGWLPRAELEAMQARPDGGLWGILLLDIYRREVLAPARLEEAS